jgi:hypothetical protein
MEARLTISAGRRPSTSLGQTDVVIPSGYPLLPIRKPASTVESLIGAHRMVRFGPRFRVGPGTTGSLLGELNEVGNVIASCFIENIKGPEKGQAARSCPPRQRRPTPGLTGSGTRVRTPPGPNTLIGEDARASPLPGLPRARRSDRLAVDRGGLAARPPRAQGAAKKDPPCCRSSPRDHGCLGSKC